MDLNACYSLMLTSFNEGRDGDCMEHIANYFEARVIKQTRSTRATDIKVLHVIEWLSKQPNFND
jgi:hypothetical protein